MGALSPNRTWEDGESLTARPCVGWRPDVVRSSFHQHNQVKTGPRFFYPRELLWYLRTATHSNANYEEPYGCRNFVG